MADTDSNLPFWMPDTRTVIVSWMMVSSFFLIVLVWYKPPGGPGSELLNTLIGMYVGTGFITAINWWMGSAKGSDANNSMAAANSEVVRKLASTPQLALPTPAVVVSWWSLLTAAEQAAIEAAATADARTAAILTALKTGKAEAPDLVDLVVKGLLTQVRADMLKAA